MERRRIGLQVNNQRRWIVFGAVASIFWGLSGIIAKFLFEVPQMTSVFLTQIRMICAGGIMVLLAALCGCHPFAVFRDRHAVLQLLIYGIIGMIPDQLFYFITVNYGNASIATILQFVGPFFCNALHGIGSPPTPPANRNHQRGRCFYWSCNGCDKRKIYPSCNYTSSFAFWNLISCRSNDNDC